MKRLGKALKDLKVGVIGVLAVAVVVKLCDIVAAEFFLVPLFFCASIPRLSASVAVPVGGDSNLFVLEVGEPFHHGHRMCINDGYPQDEKHLQSLHSCGNGGLLGAHY